MNCNGCSSDDGTTSTFMMLISKGLVSTIGPTNVGYTGCAGITQEALRVRLAEPALGVQVVCAH